MDGGTREITSVTVTLTLELTELGVFGPGSIYAQAKEATKKRLELLLAADKGSVIGEITISAISTANFTG